MADLDPLIAWDSNHSAKDRRLYHFLIRRILAAHGVKNQPGHDGPLFLAMAEPLDDKDLGFFNREFCAISCPTHPSEIQLKAIARHIAHEIAHWACYLQNDDFKYWASAPHYAENTGERISVIPYDPGVARRAFFKLWYGFARVYFVVFDVVSLQRDWPAIVTAIKGGAGRGKNALYV